MSQARTRIRIRGEGLLQDGTRYSRELSVIETLEADGTTKETSEETIKIGQEEVCFTILDYFEHFFDIFISLYFRCLSTARGGTGTASGRTSRSRF